MDEGWRLSGKVSQGMRWRWAWKRSAVSAGKLDFQTGDLTTGHCRARGIGMSFSLIEV